MVIHGDDIALHGATLQIPSFTRGKVQLSMQEGECSQMISKVRMHIERVIGLLKNKYTILQGTLPIAINGSESAYVDQILIACAA